MKRQCVKLVSAIGVAVVVMVGLVALVTTPAARADCKPVACPAIIKVCPQGQFACRPSPCNCALVCAAEGHGCNEAGEPLE